MTRARLPLEIVVSGTALLVVVSIVRLLWVPCSASRVNMLFVSRTRKSSILRACRPVPTDRLLSLVL